MHGAPQAGRAQHAVSEGGSHLSDTDWHAIRSSLEQLARDGQGRLVFRLLHPGRIVPPDAAFVSSLPPDVRVTIARQGENPAEIVVERNGEKWCAAENKLNQFPPTVRVYATRALGLVHVTHTAKDDVVKPARDDSESQDAKGTEESRIETRLQELNRHIDRILRSIDELRTQPHE